MPAGDERDVAAKSGTWENGKKKADGVTPVFPGAHSHAWYVGYTEQIATAFWVGSKDHNDTPIKDDKGRDVYGSGLPGQMWEAFMKKAHRDMRLPVKEMTDGTGGKPGDAANGELKPKPKPTSSPPAEPSPTPTATKSPSPKPKPTTPPPADTTGYTAGSTAPAKSAQLTAGNRLWLA